MKAGESIWPNKTDNGDTVMLAPSYMLLYVALVALEAQGERTTTCAVMGNPISSHKKLTTINRPGTLIRKCEPLISS